MQKKYLKTKAGYTIIETMVAVSIFLVIITSGMNALLNANLINNKSEDIRSIVDNLSFIMEEMSRNLRTGYNYHCVDNGDFSGLDVLKSCQNGGAIAFEEATGDTGVVSDQWVYRVQSTRNDPQGNPIYDVSKSIDGGATYIQLNPDEIILNSVSGFQVLGAESSDTNTQQPLVVIRLIGEIRYRNTVSPFAIQTTVSQRLIDL